MTPDERTLLTSFLRDLSAARGMAKDGEADGMIRDALAANPDAAYALVQHAIVADQSLHAAQARMAQLEEATRSASTAAGVPSTRFLPQGNGWGGATGQPEDGRYAPPPADQRPGIFSGGGGLGSFLRSAGTTAAGVAGGEMLFNGLSDLFGSHRGGGGFLGGGQGFMGGPEEVIVNNYGGDGGDWNNDDQSNW